jgi:hypothetical protein
MKNWSKIRTKLRKQRVCAPEFWVMAEVVQCFDAFYSLRDGKFSPVDLFNQAVLRDFGLRVFGVTEIMPVSPAIIHDYYSWLYKTTGGEAGIWVATPVFPGERDFPLLSRKTEPTADKFRFASILAHEFGHLKLGHEAVAVSRATPGEPFPHMSVENEWDAWIFSNFVLSFLLAEHAATSRLATGVDHGPELFGR